MRLRAIVFDEDPLMRRLLGAVFEQRDYDVFTFPDPSVCPLHVADRCPCPAGTFCTNVIISGLHMPNVNGLDFLQGLMGKGCRNPHFALNSGEWAKAEVERARRFGCRIFMRPFHTAAIIQWLEEIEPLFAPDRQLTNWYEHKWFAKGAGSSGQI